MRVVATEDFKAYINYQTLDIPEGQEIKGVTAAHLLATGSPVKRVDAEPEPQSDVTDDDQQTDGPPAGLDIDASADDVMAWVGEDPDRAEEALEAEQAKDKPRSTLVKKLEKLAE